MPISTVNTPKEALSNNVKKTLVYSFLNGFNKTKCIIFSTLQSFRRCKSTKWIFETFMVDSFGVIFDYF